MTTATTIKGVSPSAAGPRTAVGLAGLVLIVASVWFAASWIDAGDSTCGSVLRPDTWVSDNAPSSCTPVMPIRAGISLAAAAGATLLMVAGVRGRPPTWRIAGTVTIAVVLGTGVLLLVNEAVRAGGAL